MGQNFAKDLASIHGPKTSIDYVVINAGILKYPNVSIKELMESIF